MSTEIGKSSVVSIRLGSEEYERLKQIADREGVPVSTVIRRAVQVPTTMGGTILRSASMNPTTTTVVGTYSPATTLIESLQTTSEANLRYSISGGTISR